MNKIEQKARLWLMREKGLTGGQIRKSDGTPDFETPVGGFEVKLLYGDSIIFYGSQIDQLRAKPDTIIVVFSTGDDPVAEFSFSMINFATRTWGNIRIILEGGRTIRVDDTVHADIENIRLKNETKGEVVARLLNLYHLCQQLPIINPAQTLVKKALERGEDVH